MNSITDQDGVSTMHTSLPKRTAYVVQLNDTPPLYWSFATTVSTAGHWGEKKDAAQFARERDASAFMNIYLRHHAEQCKVVEI